MREEDLSGNFILPYNVDKLGTDAWLFRQCPVKFHKHL